VVSGTGQVVELDLDSGEIIRRHPVGQDPHGIDISDDDTQLYVAIKGDDSLAAIQLATGVIRTLPLGPDPYHLATIRNTGKVYVSSRKEAKLWVVSQRDLSLVGEIPIAGIGHQMVVMGEQ
jgi:DNA-binding beta-propeller fold protein YncE